jgi:transposase
MFDPTEDNWNWCPDCGEPRGVCRCDQQQPLDAVRKSIREGLTPKQKRQLMHDRFILLRRNSELKPDEQMILQLWTDNFPLLGEAYWMKEDFFKVWDCSSRGMALAWFDAWRQRLIPDLEEFYAPLLTAIQNWKPEIFAYFDCPVTNAYTEALNGIIKLIQRVGRGYSFDAIRAKVLYSEGLHKQARPNFRRMLREEEAPYLGNIPFQFLEQQYEIPVGVDISTLGRLLQGELDSDDSTRYSA